MRTHSLDAASVAQANACLPQHCALGTKPHAHCVCGLPMAMGAALCDCCLSEGLDLATVVADDPAEEWDGVRYPSRRAIRPSGIPVARYEDLLQAILGPTSNRRVRPSAAREAA